MCERNGCSLHLLDSCRHRQLLNSDLVGMVKMDSFHKRHTVRRRAGAQRPP